MSGLGPLLYEIASKFDASGFAAAQQSIVNLDKKFAAAKDSFESVTKVLASGLIANKIKDFGIESLHAFGEAEEGAARLAAAMRNLGNFTRQDVQENLDFAASLQQVTKYSDEAVVQTETLLTTFGLYGDQLRTATKATADLASGLGLDLNTAALLVGKSFVGETSTLGRYGIKIKEGTAEAEKFAAVLAEIQRRFGGAAQAEANTYLGRLEQMKNAFNDLQEKIGKELLPVAEFWLRHLKDATAMMDRLVEGQAKSASGDEIAVQQLKAKNRQILAAMNLLDQSDAKNRALYTQDIERNNKAILLIQQRINKAKELQAAEHGGPTGGPPKEVPELDQRTQDFMVSERGKALLEYHRVATGSEAKFHAGVRAEAQETAKQNAAVVRQMQQEWDQGAQTMAGGFAQAVIQMQVAGNNWREGWGQVFNAAINGMAAGFVKLANHGIKSFKDISDVASSMFDNIKQAFFQMVAQMIARYLVLKALMAVGFGPMGGGLLGGFKEGGPVPATGPYLLHAGEFVLPKHVVDQLQASRTAPAMAAGGGGGAVGVGGNITLEQHNHIDGGDPAAVARAIEEGNRRSLAWAADVSKSIYQVGKARAGETIL